MKGRIQKGETRNPGGMTKEQREARDLLAKDLSDPKRYAKFLKGYDAALEDGNPVILKDYADRVGGKVKEHLAIEDEGGNTVSPFSLMLAQFMSLPASTRDAMEIELAKKAADDGS